MVKKVPFRGKFPNSLQNVD